MKSPSTHWRASLVLPGVLVLLAGTALAQIQPPTRPRTAPAQPVAPRQQVPQRVTANRPVESDIATRNTDQVIATILAMANDEETAMARLAASKTKNEKVREFANMLIKDHTQAQEQLRSFGARFEPLSEDAGRRAELENPARPRDIARQPQIATRGQGGIDFLELDREVAQRCLGTAKRLWGENSAKEADEAFVGMRIAMHHYMIDKQEVLRGYASPQLQGVIDKSVQTTQSHLGRAKDLIHQLAGEPNSSDRKSE